MLLLLLLVINDAGGACRLRDPISGRTMHVSTTQPGVQLYTGNFLGAKQHMALCLETQNCPDAVNQPAFPSSIVGPDKEYRHVTTHAFTVA